MTRVKWDKIASIWDWLEAFSGRSISHRKTWEWVASEDGEVVAIAGDPDVLYDKLRKL